ncbi:hypothetical protein DL93DRAFT_2095012 [Clavulina sp. PMI_390]|nr:hypothetical protein DL93DRAFT_2095012 [Clavulina sp. PMI_390]
MLPHNHTIWASPILSTCSRWRECTINNPSIWSSISITKKSPDERTFCWLHRSGNGMPLRVSLDLSPEVDGTILRPYQHRIHALEVYIMRNWRVNSDNAFFPLNAGYTELKELSVSCVRAGGGKILLFRGQLGIPGIPLRNLKLDNAGVWLGGFDVGDINVQNLLSLQLSDELLPNDALRLIRRCENLRTLNWDLRHSNVGDTWEVARMRLPTLERLLLRGEGSSPLLTNMQAPKLRRLFLYLPYPQTSIYNCIPKFSSITHLQFEYAPDADRDIIAKLLHALPSLRYFDPVWRENNISGLLALCGEHFNQLPTNGLDLSSPPPYACPQMELLYIPIQSSLETYKLLPATAGGVFRAVLAIRGPLASNNLSSPIKLVVDIPHLSTLGEIPPGLKRTPKTKERTQCWLERSGSVPIHLFIAGIPPITVFDFSLHAPRIRTLVTGRPTKKLSLRNTESIVPIPFDAVNLQELDVLMVSEGYEEIFPNGTPKKLLRLRLRNILGLGEPFSLGDLDISHLEELDICDELDSDDVVRILREASCLKSLCWVSRNSSSSDGPWPAELPRLTRLLLRERSQIEPMMKINMSRLTRLQLTVLSTTREEEKDLYMALCSFPSLTHLALVIAVKLTAEDVLRILHSLPNLEYFDVPWSNENIRGILALCGTAPTSSPDDNTLLAEAPVPLSWACPKMTRCYISLFAAFMEEELSSESAASSISTLLAVRGTQRDAQKSIPLGVNPSFSVVIDVKDTDWLPMKPDILSTLPAGSIEYLPSSQFPSI